MLECDGAWVVGLVCFFGVGVGVVGGGCGCGWWLYCELGLMVFCLDFYGCWLFWFVGFFGECCVGVGGLV